MPFPDSPRVIYEKNPLVEVICQLRFPAILRIDSEIPAAYQEALRERYPIFGESQGQQNIKLDLQPELANMLGSAGPLLFRGRTSYDFISADQSWKVRLTRETLTLITSKYERWEDFKEHLRLPLELLIRDYGPAFFTRIGLRYRDVIRRSSLNLRDVNWRDLLQPHIAGELSTEVADDVLQCANQSLIRFEPESQVLINHGLVANQENEICYLIDSDFSTEQKTEINDVNQRLDDYNRQAGRLFRWCITDRLHESMGPRALAVPDAHIREQQINQSVA